MSIHLKGKKILITREAAAAQQFSQQIQAYGGKPVVTPLLEIRCVPKALNHLTDGALAQFDWIFFTSVNGVRCFFNQSPNVKNCKIAAVGPKTAKAVQDFGYEVTFMPTTYNAEVMAKEFFYLYRDSGDVLFVRGNLASSVLLDAFTAKNKPYQCVEVYETIPNVQEETHLRSVLRDETIDYLTFTSPSTINAFIQLTTGERVSKEIPVVCIGTTTEARAKEAGFMQTIVPENFTIEGMIKAIDEEIRRGD